VVKGWLDPVVRGKIQFTRSTKDLTEFIPKDQLETCYGGEDPWRYEYQEPVPGENDPMKRTEDRDVVQSARDDMVADFERETLRWVASEASTNEEKEASAKRTELANKLFANYWDLDKFVRTRTYYVRIGAISSDGKVDFGAFVVK
jgi:hypothetical protein